ncbi:hypothetical protein MHYP_G00118400 [Metynnis hypsauchen]
MDYQPIAAQEGGACRKTEPQGQGCVSGLLPSAPARCPRLLPPTLRPWRRFKRPERRMSTAAPAAPAQRPVFPSLLQLNR